MITTDTSPDTSHDPAHDTSPDMSHATGKTQSGNHRRRGVDVSTSSIVPRWFRRLVVTEGRLFAREPLGLLFVFGFPVLTVLVISGSFAEDDPGFGGATPADYYLAAYIGVTLTAVGMVMLPVHLASYRERGVLRRFRSSHFPAWSLPAAWIIIGSVVSCAGIVSLLITDQIAYGIPRPDRILLTVVSVAISVATFVEIGVFLGMLFPSARAAQSAGLALFFPSFLLGGAGPPPQVMPAAVGHVANLLPTTHAVRAIQGSWLSIGGDTGVHLAVLGGFALAATIGWIRLAGRVARS